MQFLTNVLHRRLDTSLPSSGGLHGDPVRTSPLMVPNACRSLLRVGRFSCSTGLARFQKEVRISAVILKLRLAHADGQTDEFALGTVNATTALHDGQCQVLLTSCSASSAIDQRDVQTTGPSPSRASAIDPEFLPSARIAFPYFTRLRFDLGLQTSSTVMTHHVAGSSVNP